MNIALAVAKRSPDPSTQVGAVLVSSKNTIISTGYNRPPKGISSCSMPWNRKGDPGKTKYEWVIHAERSALNDAVISTKGGKCYVTLFCCHECAKELIEAGIKEVIYLEDKYSDGWSSQLSKEMFNRLDIAFRQHRWSDKYIEEARR
jgi:dCMP deaminase